ncbi:hypothetical protein ACO0LG_19560 [Undibacterium sp. Ji42W]|uniref:hypothetical protein n=1 Tax=Undibacterium sp. Ji42W TaxID=3413039 RepID=UPI003BF2AD86
MPNNPNNTTASVGQAAAEKTTENINHTTIPFPTSDKPPQLVEQIQEKTAEVVKPVVEKLAVLKDQASTKLSSGASQAVSKLSDHSEKLYTSQAKLLDTCRIQVRKKPMTVLGLTVATVVALGYLFRRQTR